MKQRNILTLSLLFLMTFSLATDISFRQGERSGARIGFNLLKIIDMTVGIDFSSYYLAVETGSLLSTQYTAGAEVGLFMPTIGTKMLLPVSLADRINVYLGADYFLIFPHAQVLYKDSSASDGGASTEENANAAIEEVLQQFSTFGLNFYLSAEYFFDTSKQFGMSGIFGLNWINSTITPSSYAKIHAGILQTFTQWAINFYF